MSLKDLVEPDCSRESAAAELSTHFVHDQSFRDAGVEHPFQDAGGSISSPDQLINQFLAESGTRNAPKSFRMDSMLEEMRDLGSSSSQHAPIQAPGVAVLAAADPAGIADENFLWAEQFLESGKQFDQFPDGEAIWRSTVEAPDANKKFQLPEFGFGPNCVSQFLAEQKPVTDDDIFEMHRAAADLKKTASELLQNVSGTSVHRSKFMELMKEVTQGDFFFPSSAYDETFWETSGKAPAEKWAAEYMHDVTEYVDDFDLSFTGPNYTIHAQALWDKMTEVWDDLRTTTSEMKTENNSQSVKNQLYRFNAANPMFGCEDPIGKGKEKFAAGDLIGAILYFEVACQQNYENAEAWELLGIAQALNEQDSTAIICLMQAVQLDPHNLKALRVLAASLTNENFPNHACYILEKWLLANPKYQDIVEKQKDSSNASATDPKHPENEGMMADALSKSVLRSSFLKSNYFEKVKNLFLEAARRYPNDVDADVQSCLGILFNLNHDIDKAVDCFRTALQVRQDDFQLWNSYGATLANGGRGEEAVHAYRRALQIYPAFVRARYNVGITCCTLRAYREAAHHFLVSLNQQASAQEYERFYGPRRNTMSDNIWSSLRTAFTLMDEKELLKLAQQRDLESLKKEFGIQ